MRKIARFMLIAILLAGAGRVAWYASANANLMREKRELQKVVGQFERSTLDENDFHVAKRSTEKPFHYEWSFRHPKFFFLIHELNFLGRSGRGGEGRDGTALSNFGPLMRQSLFLEFGNDQILIHECGFVDRLTTIKLEPQFVQFILQNWNQLETEIAGENGFEIHHADDPVTLISIKIPLDLLAQCEEEISGSFLKDIPDRLLLEVRLFNQLARPTKRSKQ